MMEPPHSSPPRLEELTRLHENLADIDLAHYHQHGDPEVDLLADDTPSALVATSLSLQTRMDSLARAHEASRLASTVAHVEAELQRTRNEHAHAMAAATQREYALRRRLEEATQAACAAADEAGRRVSEQTQLAQWRVRQLEQRLDATEAERQQVRGA